MQQKLWKHEEISKRRKKSTPIHGPFVFRVSLTIFRTLGSYEQSPRFMEAYGDSLDNDTMGIGNGENQLREDLAEAMLETSTAPHRVAGTFIYFIHIFHAYLRYVTIFSQFVPLEPS